MTTSLNVNNIQFCKFSKSNAEQKDTYLGTHHRARVSAAIAQHVHIELALADVTSRAIQALHKHHKFSSLTF